MKLHLRLLPLLGLLILPACTTAPSPDLTRVYLPLWVEFESPVPPNRKPAEFNGSTRAMILFENSYFVTWPVEAGGVEVFVLTYLSDKSCKIQGLWTDDERAATPEGVSPRMRYGDIKCHLDTAPVPTCGFGHYVPLKSGWFAIFDEGKIGPQPVTDDSRVAALATTESLVREIGPSAKRSVGRLSLYTRRTPAAAAGPKP